MTFVTKISLKTVVKCKRGVLALATLTSCKCKATSGRFVAMQPFQDEHVVHTARV